MNRQNYAPSRLHCRIQAILTGIFFTIMMAGNGYAATGQYEGNGISFSYPENYELSTSSKKSSKTVLLKNGSNSISIQIMKNVLIDGFDDIVINQLAKRFKEEGNAVSDAKKENKQIPLMVKGEAGQLNVDAATGMIKTPLGVLSQEGIDDARGLLASLSKLRTPSKRTTGPFKTSVQDYLMLVPQVIPRKRGWIDGMFPDKDSIQKQNALLDSLEATLGAIATQPVTAATPSENVFGVTLTLTKDAAILKRVDKGIALEKTDLVEKGIHLACKPA